jgi:hypothetical protein
MKDFVRAIFASGFREVFGVSAASIAKGWFIIFYGVNTIVANSRKMFIISYLCFTSEAIERE